MQQHPALFTDLKRLAAMPPSMQRDLAQLITEESVFLREGTVFYKHESGQVFSVGKSDLVAVYGTATKAMTFTLIGSVPKSAKVFTPGEGTPAAERLDAWTDFCDKQAQAIKHCA